MDRGFAPAPERVAVRSNHLIRFRRGIVAAVRVLLAGFSAKKTWIAAARAAVRPVSDFNLTRVRSKKITINRFATGRLMMFPTLFAFCTYMPHRTRAVGFPECRSADSRAERYFKNM